jgi:hypothetical protein
MQARISHPGRASRFLLWTSLLAIALGPRFTSAQGYFGTVSGTLSDLTGAVIQGAKVMLTDSQKGYVFTTTSDSDGRYLFRSIPPGVYSLSADAKGFEKTRSTAFKVDVNQNATANLTLKVAGAAQTVTVEAASRAIQTEDAETGQVINRRFINDLPLIDRDVTQLTYLAPGVVDMSDQNQASDTGGTNFVSNGSRGASADILTDGASVTNAEPNGGITAGTYIPSPEAVEEFKVEQSNFSAEYGFSGASVVNIVTRSGTNSFHGSLYDFNRDQIFDANDWFNNHQNPQIPIPHLRRNDYGLTIGGPIRKNKTFFFFDYEGLRSARLRTAHFGVPSQAMRNGDFGEICPGNGGAWDTTAGDPNFGQCVMPGDNTTLNPTGQLWDPYSGVFDSNQNGAVRSAFIPFNNIAQYISPGCNATVLQAANGGACPPNEPAAGVPGNLIDPVAQKMMSYFPLPNSPGNLYLNWFGSGTEKGNNDQFDLKIDHRFSQNNLMSGKYSQQWSTNAGFNCYKNFTDPCGGGPNKTGAKLFAINDTHTFSPTLLVNTILGFTRGWWNILAYNPQGVSDPLGTLGFPSYLYSNNFKGVPPIYISQYSTNGGRNIGTDPYGNYKLGQDTGQLTIALDKVEGPHDLKFGVEGRIHQMNYIQTNAPLGFFSFDFNGSSQCPNNIASCGGDGMASFLMGQLTQDCVGNEGCGSYYEIQFRPATTNYQYAGYAQDNWKVNQKLTLNLGLRYDVTLPRTERFNRQNSFDLNAKSPLNNGSVTYNDAVTGQPVTVPLTGGEVFATGNHRTIYVTDWSNIQPRFGFAFQFTPKTVVRGGYGIYYGQSRSGVSGVVPYGSQGFNQYTQVIPTFQNQGNVPWLKLSNPFPFGLIQPPGSSLGLLNDVGFGANGPIETSFYNRTPYEQSWSFGIEREVPGKVLINVEYLGKKGTHLPFSGTTQHDFLGPWVEGLPVGDPSAPNPCQSLTVACLNNFVTNPFSSQNGGPISDPNSTLSSPQVQYFQLLIPHPQFTSISSDVELISNSIYHALQVSAEKRYSNGLQFLVTYTWSKSIDDSSVADDNVTWTGNTFSSLQDPNKPWLERSYSIFDIPHVLQASYSYDLPFGRGRPFLGNMPSVLQAIVGGWKTNGIWRVTSGRPLSMMLADGQSLPTYNAQRPDIVGTPRRNHAHDWVDTNYFVDVTVFQKPAPFVLGDAPRTIASVRTPTWFSTDLSLSKQFSLARVREAMNLEFRIEAKNAFNHPVFGTPDTSVDDGTTGLVSYTASTPREVQLALKINF